MKKKGRELHIGGCKGAGRQRLLVVEVKGWRSRSFVWCAVCCPLHFGNIWPLIFLAWVVSSLGFLCHLVWVMAWINMLLCHFTEFWMIILSLHFWVYGMVSFIDVALYEFLAWLLCCISMTPLKLPIKDRHLHDFSCMPPNHNFMA